MNAQRYLDEIVAPTIAEFENDPLSVRRALLACIVTFHTIDYLGRQSLQKCRRESQDFTFVEKIANAAKHHETDGQVPLRAEEVISRPPGFFDVCVLDLSRLDDPVGGITLAGQTGADVLRAVTGAAAFLRSKIGE